MGTNRLLFFLIVFLIFLNSPAVLFAQLVREDPVAVKYASTINTTDFSKYLHVLASDSLQGREAGTVGQRKAAYYLRDKMQQFGLKPVVKTDSGVSYFQHFTLAKKEWDEVYLKVAGQKREFLKDFYAYGDFDMPKEEKFKVVYAGFGIDSKNYSDYTDLDVKGKGVVLFMGEPVEKGVSLVTGANRISDWAFDWRRKSETALKKGAKAVFIVVGKDFSAFEDKLNALRHHLSQPVLTFTYKQHSGSAFFVPAKLAAEMLNTTEKELYHTQKETGSKLPTDFKFKSGKVTAKVGVKTTFIETENVLGFIEGTDRKNEVVIITAHYDHLGTQNGKVYYGADDDGSGTTALLEMAQAFARAAQEGHRPKRSILFMPVTAEEKGLLGSEYYADNPVFPLSNTVADLNIDMIGRIDTLHATPNYVYLIGSNRLSSALHKISEQTDSIYLPDLKLDYTFNAKDDPNRFYYRSDHFNFAKNNIPVIFYFSGVHKDYHKPTDTVDKINFDKAVKITKLVFYTAWNLANTDLPITVDKAGNK